MYKPAQTVHLVPGLQHSSMMSIRKFADVNYITIFTPQEVTIFYGNTTNIASTGEPTLQGWRDPASGLWQIPLLPPNQTKAQSRQQTSPTQHNQQQMSSINNVYELPSIEQVIKCHHAAAGYPAKTMWIKASIQGSLHCCQCKQQEQWLNTFQSPPKHKKATCNSKDRGLINSREETMPDTHIIHEP